MMQLELIEKRVPDKEKKIYIVGSYDNDPKKAAKKLKKWDMKMQFRVEEWKNMKAH